MRSIIQFITFAGIVLFIVSCITVPRKNAAYLNSITQMIDANADSLIISYGDSVLAGTPAYQFAQDLNRGLSSLDSATKTYTGIRRRLIIQQYLSANKNLLLLSYNGNLNIEAFSNILVLLSESRAKLRSIFPRSRQ